MCFSEAAAAPTKRPTMWFISMICNFLLYMILMIRGSFAFTSSLQYRNNIATATPSLPHPTTFVSRTKSSPPKSSNLCFPSSSLSYRQQKFHNIQLFMGLFNFLKSRSNDFVKLDSTDDVYGPGPILLLYNVPNGISDEEFGYMVEDGAPRTTTSAGGGGAIIRRLSKEDKEESTTLLEMPLSEALEQMVKQGNEKESDKEEFKPIETTDQFGTISSSSLDKESSAAGSPVLFFSGFSNSEMMETYKIIASEIYQESGGTLSAACAKAVPNAMDKPLIQVLEEISGDHADALRMRQEQQQQQQEEEQMQE